MEVIPVFHIEVSRYYLTPLRLGNVLLLIRMVLKLLLELDAILFNEKLSLPFALLYSVSLQ